MEKEYFPQHTWKNQRPVVDSLSFSSRSWQVEILAKDRLVEGQHLFPTAKLTWRHFNDKFHDKMANPNPFPDEKN